MIPENEHYLFVGNTFYTRRRDPAISELPDTAGQKPHLLSRQVAKVFPEGGNWIQYMTSLKLSSSFTKRGNSDPSLLHRSRGRAALRVRLGCGHLEYAVDAQEIVLGVQALFWRIITGKVPVKETDVKEG
ncbi:bb75720c-5569-4233-b904-c768bd637632 [Sclerotinia trifoliorum]|uniref:Bb75720c-5569-4233-b904-c768bd637632 n=1 Tax=Sclerotinia trifoliorum TaxID=28548 RepID=A0A8H2ZK95_9HELO|nr:bb75720c-5569-4233-b904-c768bd637632 [Sclerotinia trifoliorum]